MTEMITATAYAHLRPLVLFTVDLGLNRLVDTGDEITENVVAQYLVTPVT